jgi:preprotein translocase subunit Sec63
MQEIIPNNDKTTGGGLVGSHLITNLPNDMNMAQWVSFTKRLLSAVDKVSDNFPNPKLK